MKRALMAAGVLLAFSVATLFVRSRKLPEAPEHARVEPSLSDLPKVGVCWLEYARRDAPGRVAMAGFSTVPEWHVTVSGLLVRHPRGDVLVDMGFSSHYDEEIADYPRLLRFWLQQIKSPILQSAPDAVRSAGADPSKLAWAIPSHVHIDHAGGLVDLPNVPVLLAQEEIDFVAEYGNQKTRKVIPAHAKAMQGRMTALHFEKKPYEIFDESSDIFGDGSIVIVKLPGHTPGSIGTFVNVSPQTRIFYVGDTVNVAEAVEARRPKSLVMSGTDHDGDAANAVVSRLAQLRAKAPDVVILPAHDREQWARIFRGSPGCL